MNATQTQTQTQTRPETKQPWLWNVVLLDDDDHSYDYVMRMMQNLFAHDEEKAFLIAERVDNDGRAVCMTTHKEHAELKREQIIAFGRDPLMSACKGPMSAIIEPAEFDGDGSDDRKSN
jgi:ATP-dependent Clp protease adaptor protein ClpS